MRAGKACPARHPIALDPRSSRSAPAWPFLREIPRSASNNADLRSDARYFRFTNSFFFFFPDLLASSRSRTAATMMGNPTVASTKTSPNLPPSDGGTNLPHEIASEEHFLQGVDGAVRRRDRAAATSCAALRRRW